MSDFFSSGWSIYIAAVTILGLVGCLALLVIASKATVMAKDNSTGHVWDGDLTELNNPLPRWWMILFVLTIVVGGIYLTLYPGLGSAAGTMEWTSANQYQAEEQKATAAMAPIYAKFAALPAEQLAKDHQAMAIGERLFINNCAACHGSDAKGSKGLPNLTDKIWLHGWGEDAVVAMVTNGKVNVMPAQETRFTAEQIHVLGAYVWSLSHRSESVTPQ